MMVSSKGRYALRVMLDMAEQGDGAWLRLSDIAQRQQLSKKYLESIMAALSRAGLVESSVGKAGGYRLTRPPEQYTVGEILRLMEGSLSPVACLEQNPMQCTRAARCRTLPMWKELYHMVNDYFDSITLADLMDSGEAGDDYVI